MDRPGVAATVDVVIPALDEEHALPSVLRDLPVGRIRRVVVVDNGSRDRTAAVAREAGAEVVLEPRRGYGSACLAGIAALAVPGALPDVVVFLDADYSDRPSELPRLVGPIVEKGADLVVGSRTLGHAESGALLPQARFGNALATFLIRALYGVRFTDLGPFRAVRWSALERLAMSDRDFGWTVEMQVKAARLGMRCVEVPVSYRRRIGRSKISGTVVGSVRAGWKILYTIARLSVSGSRASGGPDGAAR